MPELKDPATHSRAAAVTVCLAAALTAGAACLVVNSTWGGTGSFVPATLPSAVPDDPLVASGFTAIRASYSQASAIVSYSLAKVRVLAVASYLAEDAQKATFSIGPSLEWDVLRKGPLTLTLRGDVAATERGTSGFAGVSLRLLGTRASLTTLGGARSSSIADDELGDGPAGRSPAPGMPMSRAVR